MDSENASFINDGPVVCANISAECDTDRSVETDGVGQAKTSTGAAIARRIRIHHKEIVRSLNLVELNPILWEMDIVDQQECGELLSDVTPKKRAERLLAFLETKGVDVYLKFLKCVHKETTHMGHQYVTSLLEGEDADTLDSSTKLCKQIKERSSDLMDISLRDLLPLLRRDGLLTEDEVEQLVNPHKSSKEKIQYLLYVLLYTKGPQAHSIFLSCLGEDKTNLRHRELYESITSCDPNPLKKRKMRDECLELDCVKRPKRFPQCHQIEMRGVLKSRRYFDKMQVWRKWLSNGQWRELDGEAEAYMENKSCTEMTLAVVLECAMGWIFRKDKQKALNLIENCQKVCRQRVQENKNYFFLLGRCEYTLSWLYKYFQEFDQSRKYAEMAMATLSEVEQGEDRALANYAYASIIVECLACTESPPSDEVMKAESAFRHAIDYATLYDCGLSHIADHAHIRLVHMYLGSTHYEAGTCRKCELKNTEDAWRSLQAVNPAKHPPTSRTLCLYYLAESDIHKSSRNVPNAIASASYALNIAKLNNSKSEITSAETRLRHLGESC